MQFNNILTKRQSVIKCQLFTRIAIGIGKKHAALHANIDIWHTCYMDMDMDVNMEYSMHSM